MYDALENVMCSPTKNIKVSCVGFVSRTWNGNTATKNQLPVQLYVAFAPQYSHIQKRRYEIRRRVKKNEISN